MTLAEQLRSKQKALRVEELADLLRIALRLSIKRWRMITFPSSVCEHRSVLIRITLQIGWR